jgi:hypothetical protein
MHGGVSVTSDRLSYIHAFSDGHSRTVRHAHKLRLREFVGGEVMLAHEFGAYKWI